MTQRIQQPSSRGLVVAITGADGAGKSTVVATLADRLSVSSRVERVSLGRPQSERAEHIRLRLRKSDAQASGRKRVRARVIRDALPALALAVMRWRQARAASRYAAAGAIVISDRWPTVIHGRMDGPRIDIAGGRLRRLVLAGMAGLERVIYERMRPADVAFILTVNIETAIARNDAREKEGKESREDIIRRHQENAEFEPVAHKTWRLENEGSLDDILARIEALIADDQAGR